MHVWELSFLNDFNNALLLGKAVLCATSCSNFCMKLKNFPAGNSLDSVISLADKGYGLEVTPIQNVV